jgi:hypothetical protein
MRLCFVVTLIFGLLYLVEASTKSFIDNSSEWGAQFNRNSPRPIHYIIVY